MNDPAERRADAVAAVMSDGSATLTKAELERRSVQLAHLLRQIGLVEGDRVAILLENTLDWFTTLWGVRRAGCWRCRSTGT